MNTLKQLKAYDDKLAKLEEQKAKSEGQREELLRQLQERFGVGTLEEAEKLLEQMQDDLANTEEQIEECEAELDNMISKIEGK